MAAILPILLTILKAAGQALIGMIMSLITGKTFKYLILLPFSKKVAASGTDTEKKILTEVQSDLGVDP